MRWAGFNACMNVSQTCTICSTTDGLCNCRRSLTDIFATLIEVDQRVSRSNQTSSIQVGPRDASCSIDKLELILENGIARCFMEEAAAKSGLTLEVKTLKDRKWYVTIGKDGLMAFLGHPEQYEKSSFAPMRSQTGSTPSGCSQTYSGLRS